jgi:Protein of unknown function DUF262
MKMLLREVDKQRNHVVVDNYTVTWSELLSQYLRSDIRIDPDYQRLFRWSLRQQTEYIESLLLNIPTPPIFLAEQQDGKFEVIDGLQRFSTMIKFFSKEMFPKEKIQRRAKGAANIIQIPTTLDAAPILQELHGLTRETMPETLVRTIRYSRTSVVMLKKESSPQARYYVFQRLNRSGSYLSDQEIRNSSSRLYGSTFADALKSLARKSFVLEAMSLSPEDVQQMKVEENILRLLAFNHAAPKSNRIDEFLDGFMYEASSGKFKFTAAHKSNLESTFKLIQRVFPNGEAFRFYKGGKFSGAFSTNLYDIVCSGFYSNIATLEKKNVASIRKRLIELHGNQNALAMTGPGSNTRRKMIGRVDFGKAWFSPKAKY